MQLSICFLTGRKDPRLDWLVDAVAKQRAQDDEIEIIAIDALHGTRPLVDDRVAAALGRSAARPGSPIAIRHVPPKPTIWQGPHRVTDRDWWAAASGRNTGIVLARYDYLAFLDDRAKPGSQWLATVRKARLAHDTVIAGTYDKLEGPSEARKLTIDHRRKIAPGGRPNCGGGWLYGCTFCLPLEWALAVNGLEEGCDSLTGEDYIFGMMLANAGYQIDFVPSLYVLLDREHGDVSMKGTYVCMDKGVSPHDKSHAAIARFGRRRRTELTPDLCQLRAQIAAGNDFPIPDPKGDYRDWYDDQPIRDM